jgi:Spy/CpxP family protein refolding chaperone
MKRLMLITLAAAIVVVASGVGLAQERGKQQRPQRGGQGGFGGGFGMGGTFLLNQKSVQEELKLSDEQVKKVKELSDKQRESFQGLRDLSQEERRTKMQESAKATQKAVGEILNEKQQKRLKQIELQQQGGRALANEEVAKTLNLTDEQKEKVKTIVAEGRPAAGGGAGQRGQRPDEETLKKMAEARKARDEKLLNILTPEQKAKYKELTGEPFKGTITRPQFGGAGRNRGNR